MLQATASGFRDDFARLFGGTPSDPTTSILQVRWYESPLGPMLGIASNSALELLEFTDRRGLERAIGRLCSRRKCSIIPGDNPILENLRGALNDYFSGNKLQFDLPLGLTGSPFQQAVWQQLRKIPPGATRSYTEQAKAIGKPKAVRAVARANGDNHLAIVIPCHRVIGADGKLTGYGGGLHRKRWLLDHEQRIISTRSAPAGQVAKALQGIPKHMNRSNSA